MVITMVIDQYGSENNGTTISTRRFVDEMKRQGHEVRVVTACPKGKSIDEEGVFPVKERNVFLASKIARKQGIVFGKPERKVLRQAIEGSDLVHLLMPFRLEKEAYKMAKKMGIPTTAAFHVQPENVTYNIKLDRFAIANRFVYHLFHRFYRHFNHIHCPSEFIAQELTNHGYRATLHVISNGVNSKFVPNVVEKPKQFAGKFLILNIGRLSPEKRQDVLIDAVKLSKYADRIQLIFAGNGPKKATYQKQAADLKNIPCFNFYKMNELIDTINYSDLYVHPADVEIEAIACVESFSCGLVPVIANAQKSATRQFALTEQNLFESGNAADLASKIDYWLEHEKERQLASQRYALYGQSFAVERSVRSIVAMFEQVIKEDKRKKYRQTFQNRPNNGSCATASYVNWNYHPLIEEESSGATVNGDLMRK